MKPVIALVGRPNVGKSTLFNALTRTRDALVADFAGLTRDRQYGTGRVGDRPYLVVDTGGLSGEEEGIDIHMASQALQAIAEADHVFFMLDARQGLLARDHPIAQHLRNQGKPTTLVVNKTDGLDADVALADFHQLGLGEPVAIAAVHGRGVRQLIEQTLETFPEPSEEELALEEQEGCKVAIVGRPNVGKSTLVNRMLGEDRVVVFDLPGTTRDSIYLPFERDGKPYTLIDTAGVRRRARVGEGIEKFSVIKTLQAIADANVVIMVIDAREGPSEQDAHLLGFVMDAGKALVVAVNKWDGMTLEAREHVKEELGRRFPYLDFAKRHLISALHGSGVGDLFGSVDKAYESAMVDLSTPRLTEMLEAAMFAHQPPMVGGRRIKLRYAHQGGRNPPIIVIHGNKTDDVPGAYKRYLEKWFRDKLKLVGTPIRIEFKGGENPYAGRKNALNKRQLAKRQRNITFFKKKEAQRKRKVGRG